MRKLVLLVAFVAGCDLFVSSPEPGTDGGVTFHLPECFGTDVPYEICNGLDDDCDGNADEDFEVFLHKECSELCRCNDNTLMCDVHYDGQWACGERGALVCEPTAGWSVCD